MARALKREEIEAVSAFYARPVGEAH